MSRKRIGWPGAVLALAVAGMVGAGCGTAAVTLPRNNRMLPAGAISVIERSARLNALTGAPEFGLDEQQDWADDEGWYAVEGGQIIKLYFADIDAVTRSYARRSDVAGSACVAGLMGPFSGAYVEVAMKDGKAWRLRTDPEGDPALCLNCAPFWLITFPRPIHKTRRIGEAFEYMRVRAALP
jgi:hypothetical protein